MVKNLLAYTGDIRDVVSIPGSGRYPGGGHGNLFQYFYLENPMDRGVRASEPEHAHQVLKLTIMLMQRLLCYFGFVLGHLQF